MKLRKDILYYIPILIIVILGFLLYWEDEKLNQFYLEQEEIDLKGQENIENFFKSLSEKKYDDVKKDYNIISDNPDIKTAFLFNNIEKNALNKKIVFIGNHKINLDSEQLDYLKDFKSIKNYSLRKVDYQCKFYEFKCSSIEKYQNSYLESINIELEKEIKNNS
jgi:hypothetical protein